MARATEDNATEGAPAVEAKPLEMPVKWIAALRPLLAREDRDWAKRVLKGCSSSHYEHLKMPVTMARFAGKLPEFLNFMRSQWGWIIDCDVTTGIIMMNENKSECVCPLVQKNRDPQQDLGMLCYYAEGFTEKMFAAVVGAPVRAEVTDSILRGGKSCRYRVELKPQPS